ncbi:hypothetical protein LSAT2_029106 [Lamellibrachia satsuma]|nr:hypothetical protein LSAT2_029106 [Lamellibrachia satsuma]
MASVTKQTEWNKITERGEGEGEMGEGRVRAAGGTFNGRLATRTLQLDADWTRELRDINNDLDVMRVCEAPVASGCLCPWSGWLLPNPASLLAADAASPDRTATAAVFKGQP